MLFGFVHKDFPSYIRRKKKVKSYKIFEKKCIWMPCGGGNKKMMRRPAAVTFG